MATEKVARYVVVRNLGPALEIVVPDDPERLGQELIIPAYDAVTLRSDAFAKWEDDVNLATVLASGRVVVTPSNDRARVMPQFPDSEVTDPYDKSMCYELVSGTDERFREILGTVLARDNRRAENVTYMEETFPKLLQVARDWLLRWGPPAELSWRVGELETKLAELAAKK